MKARKKFFGYRFAGLLLAGVFVSLVSGQDLVLKARDFSGKDDVWKNRFDSETMALRGNHKIISGDIWWNEFPKSGKYKIIMEGVTFKNYGENPYKFSIGGDVVKSGKVPYPPGGCRSGDHWLLDQKMDLGTHTIREGDKINYWAELAYCTGLSKPGAYASFKRLRFIPQGGTPRTSSPQIDPAGGSFDETVKITLSGESNAKIYFTLDGSEPKSSSTKYVDPFWLTVSAILKAIAIHPDKDPSSPEEAEFIIQTIPPVTVITPNGGEEIKFGEVYTIKWKTDPNVLRDVNVYFTCDGGDNWNLINGNEAVSTGDDGKGQISWKVSDHMQSPPEAQASCLVRVSSYLEAAILDDSNAGFQIVDEGTSANFPVFNTQSHPPVTEINILYPGRRDFSGVRANGKSIPLMSPEN